MSSESSKKVKIDELQVQALLLAKVVGEILRDKANLRLTSKPSLALRSITEFRKRMRVTSIEKFETTTYISTVNFYLSEEDLDEHKAVGVIVFYIAEAYIIQLLQRMNYPITDEDDEESLTDACGTFCNLIAGNFKAALQRLDYIDLTMSHFSSYQNSIPLGVEYPADQEKKYELSFEIKKNKWIMIDYIMGFIPDAPQKDNEVS